MNSPHGSSAPVLPAEVEDGLHRLATSAAVSPPYPGLDQAINRSRRRRVAGTAAVLAAVVALIGVGTTTVLNPHTSVNGDQAARQAHLPAQPIALDESVVPAAVRKAGLTGRDGVTGRIGGPLAGDVTFLAQLRQRVVDLCTNRREWPTGTADDVLVFWAGDAGGRRLAMVAWPASERHGLTFAVLAGAPGASPAQLDVYLPDTGTSSVDPAHFTDPVPFLIRGPGTAAEHGTVLVVAPGASSSELVTKRFFQAAGGAGVALQTLQRQGDLVWTGQADEQAIDLGTVRVNAKEWTMLNTDPVAVAQEKLRAAAPAGTDLDVLQQGLDVLITAKPAGDETIVVAWSDKTVKATITALVLRSPDGGYVTGVHLNAPADADADGSTMEAWSRTVDPPTTPFPTGRASSASAARPVFTPSPPMSPAGFMSAIDLEQVPGVDGATTRSLAVVAPQGAVSVRSGAATAPVHGRVALLQVPADKNGNPATVEALDAQGRTVGSVSTLFMGARVYFVDHHER